jgi:acyl dehydratase
VTTLIGYDSVEVGQALPSRSFPISRPDLVRYAGASGDFNPIHWSPRTATSVGLPDVIAHGMLTMATAVRAVTDWVGDPGAVVDYGVRFTKPVVVPDDGVGALLKVDGVVLEKLGAKADSDGGAGPRLVRVELTVRSGDDKVLGMARATVRLD